MRVSRVSKKILSIILIATLLFFIGIWSLYNVFFVSPLKKSKASLTIAKNLAVELKLANSKNALAYQELSSLNPSHPSYMDQVTLAQKNFDEGSQDIENINSKYKKINFSGTKETRDYLNSEYKKTFEEALNTTRQEINKKGSIVEAFNNSEKTLSNLITYNPYIDLGGLDFDSDLDREIALPRIDAAIAGMEKVKIQTKSLNTPKKETLIANLDSTLTLLRKLSEEIRSKNTAEAIKTRTAFLDGYKALTDEASTIVRESASIDGNASSANNEVNEKLDSLIAKTEKLFRSQPLDPLTNYWQKK